MKYKTLTTMAVAVALISGCATAGRYNYVDNNDRYYHSNRSAQTSFVDKARVISAEPIYQTVRVNQPEEQCWNERVNHRRPYKGEKSYTSTIAGAIVGGAIGNQFGKGDGKDVMTVAGMLLGGSIGNDMNRSSTTSGHYVTNERRCTTVDNYSERKELVGYNVNYRYRGKVYTTQTDSDPGNYLKLQVSFSPIE